jgi:OOP family OmpA-OmpF porin
LSVWIEQGPHAILAAVIRGTPPRELRLALQEAIERVHAFYGEALRSFDGDTRAFENLRPTLEDCLQFQYKPGTPRPSRALWAIVGVMILALVVWGYQTVQSRARWNGYLDALRAEPGIVVVAAERRAGQYVVRGLRDPLARDPASMLPAHRLAANSVSGTWQLYQALDPSLVLARARQLLRPPSTVALQYADGVLSASGDAPPDWIVDSARLAPALPGVNRYDAGAVIDGSIRRMGSALEAAPVLFVKGSTTLVPEGEQRLAAARELVRTIDALARLQDVRPRIEIKGHADSDGPPESNNPLSVRRAAYVHDVLRAENLRSVGLTAIGVGSSEPLSAGTTENDKQRNRRVSLRVLPSGSGGHER